MSSKASGEPSLLLSTSVLYALRHAVVAARKSLQAADLNGSLQEQEAFSSSIDSTGLSTAECSKGGNSFFVLAAPATTVKIKQVGIRSSAYTVLQLFSQIFDKAQIHDNCASKPFTWNPCLSCLADLLHDEF